MSVLPKPQAGFNLRCGRCRKSFRRAHSHSITWSTALVATGLLFYLILISAPLLEVMFYNRQRWSTVTTGLQMMENSGFSLLASVIFLTAILVPLVKLCGLFIVFIGLHLRKPPRWIVPIFRHIKSLNAWSMAEIFLLGFLVAYTRLQQLVHVHIEIAAFALIGLVLSMVSIDTMLDPEDVWEEMALKRLTHSHQNKENTHNTIPAWVGCSVCHQANDARTKSCFRCGAVLHHRKPESIKRTWALVISALVLYIPANIFPILQITKLKHIEGYTIWGGIADFLRTGAWPLALLVFVASMVVPFFKIVSLIFMLTTTHRRTTTTLLRRTRLYRFIDFIGRWSMIDIFMLSILVGLVQFGQLAQVSSGQGALCFAAVVILTMCAVLSFDPRLMWDAAANRRVNIPCPPSESRNL